MTSSPLLFYIDDLYLSPYTYSVLCALIEKNIPYVLKETQFEKSKALSEHFQNLTYTELIPAIQSKDFVLTESIAILEFLEEKFPAPEFPSLYPKEIHHRAQARMLLSWYRCGMQCLRKERSSETLFYSGLKSTVPLTPQAKEEFDDLTRALLGILKKGQSFLFESTWSIADSETALMIQRCLQNGDPVDPQLAAYSKKIWERPSAQKFIRHPRRDYVPYY